MSVLMIDDQKLYVAEDLGEPITVISDSINSSAAVKFWTLGQWGTMLTKRTNAVPVFIGRGDITDGVYTPDPDGSYLAQELGTTYQTLFGTGVHCACGHQRSALVSLNSTIYYSDEQISNMEDVEDNGFLSGYNANFVNVGNGEDIITGMYDFNGNLCILMQNSIWMKIGEESELIPDNFRRVLSWTGSHPHVNCAMDGTVFFGNENGVFQFNDMSAIEITEPVRHYWQNNYNKEEAWLASWSHKRWLLCKPSATANLLVCDLKGEGRKWYQINHFNARGMSGSPVGDKWCLLFDGTNTTLKSFEHTNAGSDTVTQTLRVPANYGGTHPHKKMRFSRVHLDGTGCTSLKVYTRNRPGDTWVLKHTETNPGEWTVLNNFAANECYLDLSGTGSMIIRSVAIEFDQEKI